jgi:hypothetical protein
LDLDAVADELYAVPPSAFIQRRDEFVAHAKRAGEKSAAAAINKLRKPTLGAWLANLLVHKHKEQIDELLQLGESLRSAQLNLAGTELRRLVQQRREIIGSLVSEARGLARQAGQPVGDDAGRELEATLTAALADESAAEVLRSGHLASALEHVGIGLLERDPGVGRTSSSSDRQQSPTPAKGRLGSDHRLRQHRMEAERARREAQTAVSAVARDLVKQEADRFRLQRERDQRRAEVSDLERQLNDARSAATSIEGDLRAAEKTLRETKQKKQDAESGLARAEDALRRLGK